MAFGPWGYDFREEQNQMPVKLHNDASSDGSCQQIKCGWTAVRTLQKNNSDDGTVIN